MLNDQNAEYWQNYKPGEIPSPTQEPPEELLKSISGRALDIGTGDGKIAEKLAKRKLDVFGIDIAKNIIEANIKRNSKVDYSVQDITKRTTFPDNSFDLITSRYTLTNIHQESWESLGEEVFRILKPRGLFWVFEPLVSASYSERYRLSNYLLKDKNCVYVFSEKNLAEKIKKKEDLEDAIKQKKVIRIVKHYTREELENIFKELKLIQWRRAEVNSPSGFKIETFEGVFQKQQNQ
ncbi:MAG: class I SAM-dependent methyltransferase [Candidatus Pacebacteria bacterium]|nr:class I SAM-dependent methyltransferase [Candidatus Paceibacterota bacterium]